MEQKTVEQMAAEKYPLHNVIDRDAMYTRQRAFISGYTEAQQSQPMWREIEGDKTYAIVIVRCNLYCEVFEEEVLGRYLLDDGFTHYLSYEDLLKLPTAQSK